MKRSKSVYVHAYICTHTCTHRSATCGENSGAGSICNIKGKTKAFKQLKVLGPPQRHPKCPETLYATNQNIIIWNSKIG